MDPFKEFGNWWLPESGEEPSCGGTISFGFGNEGIKLDLMGELGRGSMLSPGQSKRQYPVVFGRTVSGKLVTLEDCRPNGSSILMHPQPMVAERLVAARIYRGSLIAKRGASQCRSIFIRYQGLDDWCDTGEASFTFSPPTDEDSQHSQYLVYEPPAVECSFFGGQVSFETRPIGSYDSRELTASMRSTVRVTPSEPISFREAFDRFVIPLQNFLTFATGQAAHLVGLTFELDSAQDEANPLASFVEEAFRGWHEPGTSDFSWWQMPLPLMAVKDRIEDVLERWSGLMGKADSALDLLASLSLGPPHFLETRFMFAIQAAEVYHRRTFLNAVLSKEEHAARVQKLKGAIADQPDLIEWTKDFFINSNEPNLQARLAQLLEYVEPWFAGFIRPDYVKVAKHTRNWLTHYGNEKAERRAAKGSNLLLLTEETIALLEACILRDLGLDEEERMERMKDTRRFGIIRNNPRPPNASGK